jgi:hypothetical protein
MAADFQRAGSFFSGRGNYYFFSTLGHCARFRILLIYTYTQHLVKGK